MASPKKKKIPKSSKPLTARSQAKQQADELIANINKAIGGLEQRVAQSNQQLWRNQQHQNQGLQASEQHILLIRRVLNDALCGVTRVASVERKVFGSEETEQVQVIDWSWYTAQMDVMDGPHEFMMGMVLPDEEVEIRRAKVLKLAISKAIISTLESLVQKGEKAAREAAEDDEKFQKLIVSVLSKSPQFEWTEEWEAFSKKELLRLIAAEDAKLEALAKEKAAMEAAKEELLAETEDFAKVAGRAVKAINDGDDRAAAAAFGELEKRVEDKEKEADESAPSQQGGHPDGATFFGG
jgi:hypothetical protein